MATRTKVVEGGRSKLRFVVLDADLSDGNLNELVTAITSALRPATIITARSPERLSLKPQTSPNDEQPETDVDTDEVEQIDETPVAAPKARAPKGEPRQPQFIKDLDMAGDGVPFVDFAKQQAPRKHARRFLVACAWFKEHGGKPEVNIDMVFTAYRHANWPLGRMKDWDAVFRALRQQSAVTRTKPGHYEITAPGLGRLQNPEDSE